jgi:hypothetical protein
MKKIILFSLVLFSLFTARSQVQLGFGYGLSLPAANMQLSSNPVHSLVVDGMYFLPFSGNRFGIGAEYRLGNYAALTQEQTYIFGNGSTTRTDVRFASNVSVVSLAARYNVVQKSSFISYLGLRGGIHKFYSTIYVTDPKDATDCIPLENHNVFKDNTFSGSFAAGVQFDAQRLFKKMGRDKLWIDINAGYTLGGNIRYLNVRDMKDHHHASPAGDVGKEDEFNVQFVNVTTQNIHEHRVARVHSNPLRMAEFRIGIQQRIFIKKPR